MTPRRAAFGGAVVRVADDKPTFWDRVEAGAWEPGTLAALVPRLGPSVTFLDLGAWIGPLSLLAAAHGARVLAVEADPAAQERFRSNLAVNPDLAPRIELVAAAVAPRPGCVRLGARRKPGDSMSSVLLADGETTWSAAAVTPAELAARLGAARRLVIKIDIEGGEYALLPHLGPLLTGPDTVVLLSLHPVILAGTGASDVAAATAAALVPFAGWQAQPIESESEGGPVPGAVLARPATETWLLARP